MKDGISDRPHGSLCPFHNHLGCEDSGCAYKIPLFGVVLLATTKSEFRIALIMGKKCYKISLMIKCELLHFGRRNAKRGPPSWAAASGGTGGAEWTKG